MADNEFILKIDGPDVSPRTVDIGDLADVLKAVRGAVVAIAASVDKAEPNVSFSLVNIGDGSDELTLHCSPLIVRSARILTKALSTGRVASLPPASHSHLRALWKVTFDNGWDSCSFIGNGSAIGRGDVLSSVELFPDAALYRGYTTLYGRCYRSGGEKYKTAQLRLLDGSSITIQLKTQDLAEAIGKRHFQTVGLSGEAEWSVDGNKLVSFRAECLTEYSDRESDGKESTVIQSLEALAQAAGNRWDNVDPEEFVREQRRD